MESARLNFLRYALLIIVCGGLLIEWARFRIAPPAGKTAAIHEISARERLIGTWMLVSAKNRMNDGTEQPFLGKNAKGYLVYTADGHMCVELMNADRAKWKDFNKPTDAEKISAIDGLSAYCGRYEIDEGKAVITHFPELAWSPNYIGTIQPRPFKLYRDELTFADRVSDEPGIESYSITWRKSEP